MAGTRSSSRLSSAQKSSPVPSQESPTSGAGSKRKAETGSSPSAKRGKKNGLPQQKTLEETMDIDETENQTKQPDNKTDSAQDKKDAQTKSTESDGDDSSKARDEAKADAQAEISEEKETKNDSQNQNGQKSESQAGESKDETAQDEKEDNDEDVKEDSKVSKQNGHKDEKTETQEKIEKPAETNGDAPIESKAREGDTPSSILEKGIIYFFFRGRTGIDNPDNVEDIARSYMVLRPIPHGAKIGEGSMNEVKEGQAKCRLLALPKKVLPTSGNDKFMTFVEQAKTSFKELKDSFFPSSDYSTETVGVRHTPPATPIAEGIYAITTTGRESHLAYMLTIPTEMGEVQKDMGLKAQGSFIASVKNPQFPGPAYAQLPQMAEYSKEILDGFRGLRWLPLEPKHIDYENAQFLLIGESSGIDGALEPQQNDKGNLDPKQEMEKLEGEDEIRVKHLHGNDAVFADLGLSKNDYPKVPTTWDS